MVDLVIINYNTLDYLNKLIESIRKNTRISYNIIVVDNGSNDGSKEYLYKQEDIKVVTNEKNMGYAAACNQGIRVGIGDYIVLMNSDLEVTAEWLSPLVNCIKNNSDIAVVGPKLVNDRGLIVGAGTGFDFQLRGWLSPEDAPEFNKIADVLSVCGACYLIRRDLLEKLGYFDERYFFYFEELDYSFNAIYNGYRVVYCPESKVYHFITGYQPHSSNSGTRKSKEEYYDESREKFDAKWVYTGDSVLKKED
ncbi:MULTISPECIES: glycosyltransferase family 2 protein [unclassified Candidatus Frackibacter]|uniref:glycosyltransferase family 2 protein n=1 Tax=unclassified Candidatus Frackibacter TaxID=2648818 RepID=UPI00087E2D59|nr:MULTISPECIES: glycosyltransferase family 2 protein [unclassified Candidatus Frackibacter]SDC55268.1 Glycosyltransferase, GT2 family [Candidatus Frackibacter sp. WG11]SEM67333.1 Glycosyltransferase, GT2 family [Candidatus Frackibacter sp. WG12]SFL78611.1 Glycosyltransferase, GT2 family [Candidatus Frackibacter sp. WG13]